MGCADRESCETNVASQRVLAVVDAVEDTVGMRIAQQTYCTTTRLVVGLTRLRRHSEDDEIWNVLRPVTTPARYYTVSSHNLRRGRLFKALSTPVGASCCTTHTQSTHLLLARTYYQFRLPHIKQDHIDDRRPGTLDRKSVV